VSDEIAAALSGVVLYDGNSGKRCGDRHIKDGRRSVWNARYVPCLGAATRNNPVLKAGYQRLIASGRDPTAASLLHAQADHHPQHHESPTKRLQSQQTGERDEGRSRRRWRRGSAKP
jgi:hypothetical protein